MLYVYAKRNGENRISHFPASGEGGQVPGTALIPPALPAHCPLLGPAFQRYSVP